MPEAVIDIGGTNTRYTVTEDGEFLFEPEEVESYSPEEMIEALIGTLKEGYDLDGAKIATTGTVSDNRDKVERMNINGEEFRDVRPETGIDVVFENDTNAAALGEFFHGAGREYDDILYVTLSTGISGGLVQNSELVTGSNGNFGKLGHYFLGEGEWEQLTAGKGVTEVPDKASFDEDLLEDIDSAEELYSRGEEEPEIERYLREYVGRKNAEGIAQAVLSYDPETVILGGSIARENPNQVLSPVLEHFELFYPENYERPSIVLSELGDAELYGVSHI